ncbi:MAG: GIY-YIG nuclease family protein, partial [Symploca sp. SIO1C4]|nr:GIY-YIG nuclease family protein [Symploca sp. SIO1C4]
VKQTRQNKTDIMLSLLLNSIPSLHITERVKLPAQPGLYFVYTLDHQLLYLGKADNLKTRWNSHHKYQSFIETSMDCRIGYFTFDSIENLTQTIEEFEAEPTQTVQNNALVTASQLEEVKQELATVKQQLNDTLSTLIQLGSDSVIKKLKNYLPPRGLQSWKPSSDEMKNGINRSSLAKQFGFNTVKELEDAASLLKLDPIEYLEELSGWTNQPTGEGRSSSKFFAPKNSTDLESPDSSVKTEEN